MSPTAVAISKQFEKCRLSAWLDTVAQPPRWTIGWGYAGPDVHSGLVWTQDQADQNQIDRLSRIESQVRSLVHVQITEPQLGALISLADNAGIGIEQNSKLIAAINRRDWTAAAKEFLDDDHAGGKEIAGLLSRRCYEVYVFLTNKPS